MAGRDAKDIATIQDGKKDPVPPDLTVKVPDHQAMAQQSDTKDTCLEAANWRLMMPITSTGRKVKCRRLMKGRAL